MCSPIAAEIMAHAGHDFLMIDTEHSPAGPETVLAMVQAMSSTNCTPIARVSSNDASKVKQMLDVGLQGVVVPMVNSEDEAKAAVAACRYPPEGTRGFAASRASLWGARLADYAKHANAEVCCVIQIEHPDAVDRVEKILAVNGVDVAYVGVADLAAFLGFAGQMSGLDKEIEEAISRVARAAERAGVPAGIHCLSPEDAAMRIAQGFRYVAIGGDARYVGGTARDRLAQIKQLVDGTSVNSSKILTAGG